MFERLSSRPTVVARARPQGGKEAADRIGARPLS